MLARFFSTLVIVLALGLPPRAVRADDNASEPLVLSNQGKLSPAKYTAAQLATMWSAFPHKPLESAGFNALSLPFHYEDKTGNGDADEANTFAFLLSNALDWCPGCYCQRHAYFVFERSRDDELALATEYSPTAISDLVHRWVATHAIGGTITKTENGYTAALEIFAPDGHRVDYETFEKARSYFDLLGDVSVAAMKFFGEPPTDALASYLKTPRCNDPKLLAIWGTAAFEPRARMLEIADQVLTADPDFAEVRAWAANQRGWDADSADHQARENFKSLQSYLSSETLRTIQLNAAPELSKDAAAAWWKKVETLSPPGSPLRVIHSIQEAERSGQWDDRVIDTALAACAKYPNNYALVYDSGYIHYSLRPGRVDVDIAASMYLTAIQNRQLTGSGTKQDGRIAFSQLMAYLGRPDIVPAVLQGDAGLLPEDQTRLLINSFCDLGQYQAALNVYEAQRTGLRRYAGISAIRAVFAAAMLGQRDALDMLVQRDHAAIDSLHCLPLAYAYQDMLAGKQIDLQALAAGSGLGLTHWQYMILIAQLDLRAGNETFRDQLFNEESSFPDSRISWILINAYEQRNPRPESANFYRTLQWLYPDDAWITSAASETLNKLPQAPAADIAGMTALMKDLPTDPWKPGDKPPLGLNVAQVKKQATPWNITAAIRKLCENHDFKSARDLASRYNHFCAFADSPDLFYWSSHLIHKVAECENNN
jgi:hypothetical protein